jgi:hypothetical protein
MHQSARPTRNGFLFVLAAAFIVSAIPARADLPERPGIPVVYVEGKKCLIVGFKGTIPVALVNGEKVKSSSDHTSLVPGEHFAEGLVRVTEAHAYNQTNDWDLLGTHTVDKYFVFNGSLTSDRDLKDVFILLLDFEDLGTNFDVAPQVAILGKSVGDLTANKEKVIDVDFPQLKTKYRTRWTLLLFSGGIAVHTSLGNQVLDALFDLEDRVGLQKAIAARNSGNFPAMIYRHFPLKFPDPVKAQYAGQTVRLQLRITEDGRLDRLENAGDFDPALANAAMLQLSNWLFVPAVRDGQTMEATATIPLKF